MIPAILNWAETEAGQLVLFGALKILGVFSVVMFIVAYAVWVERRTAAFIQDRVGPNRVGPLGLLQPVADAIKSFLKEDFTPAHVRKVYYWLAPAIVMIPSLLTVAIIPFGSLLGGQKMVIADLNVGILYTFGIVSLGVYGIVLAGYAARSKYPLIGGLRSSAQLISYEIALGMAVIPLFLIAGGLEAPAASAGWQKLLAGTSSLNLGRLVSWQALHGWFILYAPVSFVICLAAMFAETNRMPFDLPESEQELAGGYNVEYSSMKFALFFMGEYANMVAAAALMTTLFLGGWSLPVAGLNQPAATIGAGLLHIGIFLAKMCFLIFMVIWVRWMWPRFRYDQLMDLGWRRFIPLALANIVVTAAVLWIRS
ncbi:MAG TPA: NADH-quinone oxidoreductase subunit H [Verrucomicrobiota bacterium]|jgi:NADH-quinone oxidoreductase subunit H|nr:NADH-quinone oxidoreductase subunit H [Verrucomicrobiota bacterium]OQC26919.1 MAG: NADH-quinone oxidoreductase subunit 8 [Verrucomicrobia bacterium ADurb.Bin063]HRR63524.1 NADH-quinone oxidoreductase subunit H [Candidatus Paceibacterota bacterium]MBP8014369.1 NADH-quinone oxidoreductase subunit H [Verrucomicrobiota bacterium]MDI9373683.1 NADH-quinone oxidoreductase subunit H [Verrucomicrobiota bacterium]